MDTTHTYTTPGTYTITLALNGASRWTFNGVGPLVPKAGTTASNVYVSYMPDFSLFGDSATNVGNYFFHSFNGNGALTALSTGSFDTSNITTVGNYFFYQFNLEGNLTSLPERSFDISNIGTVGSAFFQAFNQQGNLTSLAS